MFDRLVITPNLRSYKLLYKNLRYYNLRIYNRPTLDKVAIVWEGDSDNLLGLPKVKDILIETRTGERFSVLY